MRRLAFRAAALGLAIGSLTLTGCGGWLYSAKSGGSRDDALTYYLPMRYMKVRFERQKAAADPVNTLAKAESEAKAAGSALAESAQALTKAQADLAALVSAGVTPERPEHVAAAKAVADAGVASKKAEAADTSAKKKVSDAKLALQAWLNADALCGYVDRISFILEPAVADVAHSFVLRRNHWPTRSESLKLKVSSSGLLSSGDTKVEDQTAEALVALAQAAGAVRGAGPTPLVFRPGAAPETVRCEKASVDAVMRAFTMETVVDPTDTDAINVFLSSVSSVAFSEKVKAVINAGGGEVGKSGYAVESAPVTKRAGGQWQARTTGTPPTAAPGLFYRTEYPLTLKVKLDDAAIAGVMLQIPNGAPAEFMAVKAGAFGKVEHSFVMDNGVLTSLDSSRDSEALKVAKLPLDVIDGFLSSVSQIVQLRLNLGGQAADLAGKDKDLVAQQVELLKAQQQLLVEQEKLNDLKSELAGTEDTAGSSPAGGDGGSTD
ncbi:MAG: hypothetical protein J0M16_00920 [Gammaproteobacteria bacterium]|nr:hypothetical protein [Gammaproteobacteria bacterium]